MTPERGEGVLVVGGGIGGLAAAVALRRVGIPASVYERAPEVREVGAGLSLWSNAVRALRRLGLEDEVLARGSPIEVAVTRTDRGEVLGETMIGEMGRRAGGPAPRPSAPTGPTCNNSWPRPWSRGRST